jgi:2-oxo-4-hydroxy-4-carboxy-5-ureidoimidazoline decarboxylase
MDVPGLNRVPRERFVEIFGDVFERSRWVAERAYDARPFRSVEELHAAMVRVVNTATLAEQLALLREHPELAGREAEEGVMTAASTSEQRRLGFDALPPAELERMTRLNRAYRAKFGFPCIIALRAHRTRDTVVAEQERRLANDLETEIGTCLAQVFLITRGRLDALLAAPPGPAPGA